MTNKREPSERSIAPCAELTILGTTDVHGHVLAYDYLADHARSGIGFAHAAHLIEDIRTEKPNVLLFDNGDFLQGTPLSERSLGEGDRGLSENPVIKAMNQLKYDAVALGNHDFTFSENSLSELPLALDAPLLCANLLHSAKHPNAGNPILQPWQLLDRTVCDHDGEIHPIRIGVIGFGPSESETWELSRLPTGTSIISVAEAAHRELPKLKSAGADIVIALCHEGLSEADGHVDTQSAPMQLAAMDGIDAVFAGHVHQAFPSPGPQVTGLDREKGTAHGTPVAMAGHLGALVGMIHLEIQRDPDGNWAVTNGTAELLSTPRTVTPPALATEIRAAVGSSHDATRTALATPIAESPIRLHSYLSLVSPDAPLQLVADAQRVIAREILGSLPDMPNLPLLSAVTPYRAGGLAGPQNYIDFPAGMITRRNILELYQFPNCLSILETTGAQLRDWLGEAAEIFSPHSNDERDAPLHNPNVPSYHFDVVDGLTYEFDIINGALANLSFNRRPVADSDRFLVATNSFRAGSLVKSGLKLVYHDHRMIRDLIDEALRTARISPAAEPRPTWKLSAPRGHTRTFLSAPPDRIGDVSLAGKSITPIGPADDGFWRYRLTVL